MREISYKKVSIGIMISYLGVGMMGRAMRTWIGHDNWDYFMMPITWLVFTWIIKNKLPKVKSVVKTSIRYKVRQWALNFAVITLFINVLIGLINGFGKNPIAIEMYRMMLNLWTWIPALIGREYIRSYLASIYVKKGQLGRSLAIASFITVMSISLVPVFDMNSLEEGIIWFVSHALPELCENILATYLVLYGGVETSIYYLMITKGYEWIMPVLPHTDWFARSIMGIGIPIFISAWIYKEYLKLSKQIKQNENQEKKLGQWIGVGTLSVMIIWFVIGVFPVYPSAVLSGSMEPMLQVGDIVLIKQIRDKETLRKLEIGDVIQFKKNHLDIFHRIEEIKEQAGVPTYYTKGDNNTTRDDEAVQVGEIRGKVVGVIPKIGWLTIALRKGLVPFL